MPGNPRSRVVPSIRERMPSRPRSGRDSRRPGSSRRRCCRRRCSPSCTCRRRVFGSGRCWRTGSNRALSRRSIRRKRRRSPGFRWPTSPIRRTAGWCGTPVASSVRPSGSPTWWCGASPPLWWTSCSNSAAGRGRGTASGPSTCRTCDEHPPVAREDPAMTVVDVIVVLLVIAAAVSGFRQGFITAMFTLVTAVAGAIVAIQLAPLLMAHVDDPTAKIAIGIACVVVGVGVGEVAGSTVGRAISQRISWRPAQAVDRTLGLFGYAIAVLMVIWLIAVPLASVPYPWLSSAMRGSSVLAGVNAVMPSKAQDISAQLREVFTDSGFPGILDPLAATPITSVNPPDPAAGSTAAVAAAGDSILKVRSVAESCSRSMEGTGFVIGAGKLLTNAHVVAGSNSATVEFAGRTLDATVVLYDAQRDLAVLDVPGLTAAPLRFASAPAAVGADAIVAGYPLDGPYTLTPARVRASIQLRGPNIYSSATVTREVYTLRAQVRPGNSGGPLLAPDGAVLGVIFGAAIDETDVGFALTAAEVAPVVQAGLSDETAASTEACTAA